MLYLLFYKGCIKTSSLLFWVHTDINAIITHLAFIAPGNDFVMSCRFKMSWGLQGMFNKLCVCVCVAYPDHTEKCRCALALKMRAFNNALKKESKRKWSVIRSE